MFDLSVNSFILGIAPHFWLLQQWGDKGASGMHDSISPKSTNTSFFFILLSHAQGPGAWGPSGGCPVDRNNATEQGIAHHGC